MASFSDIFYNYASFLFVEITVCFNAQVYSNWVHVALTPTGFPIILYHRYAPCDYARCS